jgi:FimV-like protein
MQLPIEVTRAYHSLYTQIKPIIFYLKTHASARYGLFVGVLIFVGLSLLSSKPKPKKESVSGKKASGLISIFTNKDFNAISGEDVIATQLDLAKAYIEMDKKPLAKNLLNQVIKEGSNPQKEEARKLLKTC